VQALQQAVVTARASGQEAEATAAAWLLGVTLGASGRYGSALTVLDALRNPRLLSREVIAGLVVALALIPEAISFSIIAGVDPRVGLFSSFVMAVSIAFLGGRPAMITAASS